MTNHYSQSMTLSKHDRRWLAYWSQAKPLPAAYYAELWVYLEGDGGLHVWHWLNERDLSHFNPKARAPDTEYKRELIEVSENPHLAQLRERIDDAEPPFNNDLVTMERVLTFLDDSRLDAGKVGGWLRELGCVRLVGQRKIDGRNKKARCWCVRDHDRYAALSPSELYGMAEVASREGYAPDA